MLTWSQTHQLSNKENVLCHEREALPVLQLLSKCTHNYFKGTHNTARSKIKVVIEISYISASALATGN